MTRGPETPPNPTERPPAGADARPAAGAVDRSTAGAADRSTAGDADHSPSGGADHTPAGGPDPASDADPPVRTGPIGIMAAMPQEVDRLDAAVEQPETIDRGGRRFVRGQLAGHEVVVVGARCGKVAAATTATELIGFHDVRAIVFTGVAGAVAPGLRVGDVVVADALVQHDMDARPIFPRYEVPLLDRARFPTDPLLTDHLQAAAEAFVRDDLEAAIEPALCARLGLESPRVVRGLVATGDRFVASHDAVETLRSELPDAQCVEMEGAAVAQVAWELGVPVAVVRTISDGADDTAASDFWDALAAIAAAYGVGIVTRWLQRVARRSRPDAGDAAGHADSVESVSDAHDA